jgi:hypothetical protein
MTEPMVTSVMTDGATGLGQIYSLGVHGIQGVPMAGFTPGPLSCRHLLSGRAGDRTMDGGDDFEMPAEAGDRQDVGRR